MEQGFEGHRGSSVSGARGCVALLACGGVSLVLGVVAPSAAAPAPPFAGPRHYATDENPQKLAIGDLNGDGKPDLVTANYNPSTVSVLLNRGDGSLRARRDYATGISPTSVAIGDLNGDGKPDLASANEFESTASVLLNEGDGSFSGRRDYTTGHSPESVAIGDLNGDGKPDLASANWGSASVLLGRGDGRFQPKVDYPTTGPGGITSVAIGDLNRDGKPDLVVTASGGSSAVSVLLNEGDGSFEAKRDYQTGRAPVSVVAGDLNGDGKPDLATANVGPNSVSVLLGRGDGSFQARRDYATGAEPESIAIGDLNGDRKPDLATSSFVGSVSVLANKGDGSFQAKRDYAVPNPTNNLGALAIGDLNGDGKLDLAVTEDSNTVAVLLNATGLCAVPNAKGKTLPGAKRSITRSGCRVGSIRRTWSNKAKGGRVISQTPRFGTVLPKGAQVNLVVSRGRKH